MPQSVLVSLTSVEIHLSARYAGSVCTVDNLLDKIHLRIGCPGCKVDLGLDLVEYFTCLHERGQILGSRHKVYILVVKTGTDDKRLLLSCNTSLIFQLSILCTNNWQYISSLPLASPIACTV